MPVAVEKKELTSAEVAEAAEGMFAPQAMEVDYCKPSEQPALPPAQIETVTIFDWDDTLLPSTLLAARGYRLDGEFERCADIEPQLRKLELAIVSVLEAALRAGPVHIVTNAEEGWVQMSAEKFMPGVIDVLRKVTVISARSTYEASYPGKPLHWKICAMEQKLLQSFLESSSVKNVLSFGDSHVEREAVKVAASSVQSDPSCRSNVRTKSVKFSERPSIEQLRRQLELVLNCMASLQTYEGDLDLMLQITPSAEQQPQGA